MPLFNFDIVDGVRSPDQEGTEVLNAVAARLDAVRFVGTSLSEGPDPAWDGSTLRVLVFDERRTHPTSIPISASDSPEMQDRIDAQEHASERQVTRRHRL